MQGNLPMFLIEFSLAFPKRFRFKYEDGLFRGMLWAVLLLFAVLLELRSNLTLSDEKTKASESDGWGRSIRPIFRAICC